MDRWDQEQRRHPLWRMSESPVKCEGAFDNGKSQDVVSIWGQPTSWSECSAHRDPEGRPFRNTCQSGRSRTGGKWFPKMLSIYRKHLVTKTQTKKQNILESVWNFKTLPMLLVCIFLYTSIESPVTTNKAFLAFQSVIETSQSPVSSSILSTCWPHVSQHPEWFINIYNTVWDKKRYKAG